MKTNRIVFLLSSALLLAACREGTEPSSSSTYPPAESSTTSAVSSDSASSSAPSGSTSSSTPSSESTSTSFTWEHSSSSIDGTEITKEIYKRPAKKAFEDALDAIPALDEIGSLSQNGRGYIQMTGDNYALNIPTNSGSSEETHVFSGDALYVLSDVEVLFGLKGMKSHDSKKMNGYGAMDGEVDYVYNGSVDGISKSDKGTKGFGAFAYLQNDIFYLDGSQSIKPGESLLGNPKVCFNVTETVAYMKDLIQETIGPSSSESSSPFEFKYSATMVTTLLKTISDKQTYYKMNNGDYSVHYTLNYGSIYDLIAMGAEKSEDLKKILNKLPTPEKVDLTRSNLYFTYSEAKIYFCGVDFEGTILEDHYTTNFAFQNDAGFVYGQDVTVLAPTDTSTYVDLTPKKKENA